LTWSDVAVAGAFVLGTIGGAVAAIRIMRYVLDYVRREQDRRPPE
jgi:hypothetical protein